MRILRAKLGLLLAFVILASLSPSSAVPVVETGQGPALASIGPLTFAPDGTLFAADNQGAAIFALDLGAQVNGGVAGAKALDALDEKLAALLGTGARAHAEHAACGFSHAFQQSVGLRADSIGGGESAAA